MDLWLKLEQVLNQLNDALSQLVKSGVDYCENNRKYQKEKSKEILRLKKEGMPITLIPQMIKGVDHIADLDFERNVADVIYKANLETINIKKLEARVLEKQIEREYGQNE